MSPTPRRPLPCRHFGRVAAVLLMATGVAASPAAAESPPQSATHGEGPAAAQLVQDTAFRHADHSAYECVRCHAPTGDHGSLRVRTIEDCRACHHTPPVVEMCSDCHAGAERSPQLFELPRVLTIARGRTADRFLPFQHSSHEGVTCVSCHTLGPEFSGAAVECTSCHLEHHEADSDCSACHLEPPADVHPLEAHAGCSGATCHGDPTLVSVSESRSFCLVCHRDQVEHVPGRSCAVCHLMPHPDVR